MNNFTKGIFSVNLRNLRATFFLQQIAQIFAEYSIFQIILKNLNSLLNFKHFIIFGQLGVFKNGFGFL